MWATLRCVCADLNQLCLLKQTGRKVDCGSCLLVRSIATLLVSQVICIVLQRFRLPDQSHLHHTLRKQSEAICALGVLRRTTVEAIFIVYKSFSSLSSRLNCPAPLIALKSDCSRSSRSLASPPKESNRGTKSNSSFAAIL